MLKLFSRANLPLLRNNQQPFSIIGNQTPSKDAEVPLFSSRTLSSKSTQSSITPSTPSLSAQEEQDSEQLSA